MTQKEKDLLLKDLSARLPYGVKVTIELSKDKYTNVYDLKAIDNDSTAELRQQVTIWKYGVHNSVISYPLTDCKPYLRSMSSMTEEEIEELKTLCSIYIPTDSPTIAFEEYGILVFTHHLTNNTYSFRLNLDAIDWLNKKMFDYRGLIEKGLAIKVTENNNPYKY